MWNRATTIKLAIALAMGAGLAGCVSPRAYETEPVEVSTRNGTVTCQLYTRQLVVWDRAIDRPDAMSVEAADRVCVAEGARRASNG